MNIFELFEHLKEFNEFGIAGKPRLSQILQQKIFWKKKELQLKKVTMKILCKIATNCKF